MRVQTRDCMRKSARMNLIKMVRFGVLGLLISLSLSATTFAGEFDVQVPHTTATDALKIQIQFPTTETVQIEIYNIIGKIQKAGTFTAIANATSVIDLNLSNLTPGIYFIRTYSGNTSITRKFIKN